MSSSNKNTIDISRFVSVGDSITAGYTDGALYYEGQQNCYPNLLAKQFKLSADDFKQPLLNHDSAGVSFFRNSRMVLKQLKGCSGKKALTISYLEQHGDLNALAKNCYADLGPFNNMAVPGVKAITTLAPGYGNPENGEGNYNPFFTRMASDLSSASVLSDALTIDPTFFTLFLGNNDVLAYALSGGTMDAITPLHGSAGVGFKESLLAIVKALMANGAKGVIANIPDISSVPYFTTIPYNGLLLDKERCEELNTSYNSKNIYFIEGKNPFLIEDPLNSNGFRKIKKGEFVLLDLMLDEDKCNYLKALKPIPKKYVLTLSEINAVQKAVDEYNEVIHSIAIENCLAFVNANAMLRLVKPDRVFNRTSLNLKYKTRGVFSLDGLHINALGQVVLANEFIKAINSTYSCAIPKINFAKYRKAVTKKMQGKAS